jgi:carbonic anhydrase/acetyltransferase-like protein (isoleucine patch superfamily)
MLKSFNGKSPRIAPSALISEAAYILGDVEIGENSSVWPGAVIRGDVAQIKIGNGVHIQDNCVVHTEFGLETQDNIVIAHAVVVHCCKIGSNVMIGNNSTLLDNCEIGSNCMIGAGALIAPNARIPDNSLVIGIPGRRENISQKHLDMIGFSIEYYAKLVREYKQQGF